MKPPYLTRSRAVAIEIPQAQLGVPTVRPPKSRRRTGTGFEHEEGTTVLTTTFSPIEEPWRGSADRVAMHSVSAGVSPPGLRASTGGDSTMRGCLRHFDFRCCLDPRR
jgi:hypothetical protein